MSGIAYETRGSQATKGIKRLNRGEAALRLNPYVKFMRGQAASTGNRCARSREKRVDAPHRRGVKLV